jgi:hypothetical protein
MSKTQIGYRNDLEASFKYDNQFIQDYIKNVRETLKPYKLEEKVNNLDLLLSPVASIRKTYYDMHIDSLPEFMDEKALMSNFTYNFDYIQRNLNRVSQITRKFKIDKEGNLVEPDYIVYAQNSEQEQLYNELTKVVDTLNQFYIKRGNEFTVQLGNVARSFGNFIHTDIARLPMLEINIHEVLNYKIT